MTTSIQLMGQLESTWVKAAEFGVLAFLLVLVLTSVGFALWKLGSRLTEATADSLTRQAVSGEQTADAVTRIGELTAEIHVQNRQNAELLSEIRQYANITQTSVGSLEELVRELTRKPG